MVFTVYSRLVAAVVLLVTHSVGFQPTPKAFGWNY
jgi:hypothetical protein